MPNATLIVEANVSQKPNGLRISVYTCDYFSGFNLAEMRRFVTNQ